MAAEEEEKKEEAGVQHSSPGQVKALLASAYMSRKRRMQKVLDDPEIETLQSS